MLPYRSKFNPWELPMSNLQPLQAADITFHIEALKPLPVRGGQTAISELTVCASTQSAQHQLTQNFIKQVYEVSHKAKLSYFMPLLFSGFSAPYNCLDASTNTFIPSVAIGLKPVTQSAVFLEQYLSAPIDVAITQIAGKPVARERIVEIGNLASQSAGNARLMIAFLVFYLSTVDLEGPQTCQPNISTKADWAVCTGTNAVRHILASMGIESHVIAKATIEALTSPEEQSSWGSYYDNNPLVLAIDVAKAKTVCDPLYNYNQGMINDAAYNHPQALRANTPQRSLQSTVSKPIKQLDYA